MSLGKTFWELLRQRGESPALISVQEGPSGAVAESHTASRVQSQAIRLALALKREGMGPGERVLLTCPPGAEALMVALATWMLGSVTIHLEPGLSEALLIDALERSKAGWIVVDRLRTLGALELASGSSVKAARILMIEEAPKSSAPTVIGYAALMEAGLRFQGVGVSDLARTMFQIPPEARAAILYWSRDGELSAAALNHGELLSALAPLPLRWGFGADDVAFINMEIGGRNGLLATLRLMHQGLTLAFTAHQSLLMESARASRPSLLVMGPEDLGRLLEDLDRALNHTAVRGTLKRGLDWIGRQRQKRDEGEDALGQVVDRMDGWLERDLGGELVKALGGRLKRVWIPEGTLEKDTRALLQSAGVQIQEGN